MTHQYQLNGYNLVVDTYSGAVHVVDELAYDVIALYESTPRDELVRMVSEKHPGADVAASVCCAAGVESSTPSSSASTPSGSAIRPSARERTTSIGSGVSLPGRSTSSSKRTPRSGA